LIPYQLIRRAFHSCNMPTIVHFEIPSDNVERSSKFYNGLFGWSIEKVPQEKMPEGMEYWMITTTDDKGNKALGGGMMKRQNSEHQGITNYINVKSVLEHSARLNN
jgi:predicted enzyme related to lactoylglutathione lyase